MSWNELRTEMMLRGLPFTKDSGRSRAAATTLLAAGAAVVLAVVVVVVVAVHCHVLQRPVQHNEAHVV
jgi:hypothetical protein